jgi:hypothetical protein
MAGEEKLLSELLDWYRAVNFKALRDTLIEAVPEDDKKLVYELTTEDRTSNEIAAIAQAAGRNLNPRTIRRWQAEWVTRGLVRQVSPMKRQRIFSLPDFDIPLPGGVPSEAGPAGREDNAPPEPTSSTQEGNG